MGEELVANIFEGMTKEVLREQMNRLDVVPRGLKGRNDVGWRNLNKVRVSEMRKLCVSAFPSPILARTITHQITVVQVACIME